MCCKPAEAAAGGGLAHAAGLLLRASSLGRAPSSRADCRGVLAVRRVLSLGFLHMKDKLLPWKGVTGV